jgi:hypothetical protein
LPSVASHSVSKRPIWLLDAAARSSPSRSTIARMGWITGEPLGVVDVLVSGEPPKHRSPKQSAQRVTPVLAAAAIEELTEVVVPRALFAEVLRRIDRLRPRPPPLPA